MSMLKPPRFAGASILAFLAGCSSAPGSTPAGAAAPGSADGDGDGFGVGRDCRGSDCNDFVAAVHEEAECEAWCADAGDAPGCACATLEPVECYLGAAETRDVGPCRAGLSRCIDGTRGPCEGEVVPVDETCDGVDNDCDAEIDDGALSACGTCGECETDCRGPDAGCAAWGDETSGDVVETPEGWLTLDGSAVDLHVIWPSSSETGEIFRVDTVTHDVQASFWTGPNHSGSASWGSDSPSRSAVDDEG